MADGKWKCNILEHQEPEVREGRIQGKHYHDSEADAIECANKRIAEEQADFENSNSLTF